MADTFPCDPLTVGTINCLTRILDDDLKRNMPGLETCSEAGKKYWREQFDRAEKEGACGTSASAIVCYASRADSRASDIVTCTQARTTKKKLRRLVRIWIPRSSKG